MDAYFAIALVAATAAAVEMSRRKSTRDARSSRPLELMPPRNVAQSSDGQLVRLVGEVEAGSATLCAPISARACVVYALTIVRLGGRGEQCTRWLEIGAECGVARFLLRDRSGVAVVEGDAAHTVLNGPGLVTRCTYGDAPPALRHALSRRGYDRESIGGRHAVLECLEVVLAPGDRVAVGGLATWESDAAGEQGASVTPFRNAPRRLRMRAPANDKMLLELDAEFART